MDSEPRLGRYGSIWCKDTLVHEASSLGNFFFCAFSFGETTVFKSLGLGAVQCPGSVASGIKTVFASASSVLASMTFAAGQTIYGMWTSFTLASGGCIAYKEASANVATG
jgi:hypothetical protein